MARGELIAEGTYEYSEGENITGRESWQLSRLGHGGLIFNSRLDRTRPDTQSWVVTYELSGKWSPRGLTIRHEHDHQVMRAQHQAKGKKWLAHVESPAGAQDFTLDFSPTHEILFVSPLFSGVILLRAMLAQGQSREVDAISIQSGSLAPAAEKQTWQCVGEDKIVTPAGEFQAFKYESKGASEALTLWADTRGIVLRVTSAVSEIQLTHYLWHARM